MQPAPQGIAAVHRKGVIQGHIRHTAEGGVVGGDGDGHGLTVLGNFHGAGLLQVVADPRLFPEQVHAAAVVGVGHRAPPAVQFPVEPPVGVAAPPFGQCHLDTGGDHPVKSAGLEGRQIVQTLPVPHGVDDVIRTGGLQLTSHGFQGAGIGAEEGLALVHSFFGGQLVRLIPEPAAQFRHIGQVPMAAQAALHLPGHTHSQHGTGKQGADRPGAAAQDAGRLLAAVQQAFGPKQQGAHRKQRQQNGQQRLGPTGGAAFPGAGKDAVKQVPQRHAQAESKPGSRQGSRAGRATAEDAHRKQDRQNQAESPGRLGDIIGNVAEFAVGGGAVIPNLEGTDPPGLLQPGNGMPPADGQHRYAQSRTADEDILPHPHKDLFPGGAILPQQEQTVPQRHRNVHGGAHIIAPGHQESRRGGHHHPGGHSPAPLHRAVPAAPDAQPQQDQQNGQGQRAPPHHAGAVAVSGGVFDQRADLRLKGNRNVMGDHQEPGTQGGADSHGAAAAAQHHQTGGQHQQFKVEPGAEVGGKHAAAETVAQHQQQSAHAVQFPRPQVDRKVLVRGLPGQQMPHRVVVLEIAVHDLVAGVVVGFQPVNSRQPRQNGQDQHPGKDSFQGMFQDSGSPFPVQR